MALSMEQRADYRISNLGFGILKEKVAEVRGINNCL